MTKRKSTTRTIKTKGLRYQRKIGNTLCNKMKKLKEIWLFRKLKNTTLSNGQFAVDYLMELPKQYRMVAAESIIECIRLSYPLNNMEITCKARELNRKRLGIV